MSTGVEPSSVDAVVIVLDPRVTYVGIGPDDGPVAQAARACQADDVIEDLADAAEQLDFSYMRAWERVARRIAPNAAWDVSSPYHQSPDESPLRGAVAQSDRGVVIGAELLDQITSAISVEVQDLSFGATRWAVIDGGRMVGSATVEHTVMSIEDHHMARVAARLRADGEVLRHVEGEDLSLEIIEPGAGSRDNLGALGYVLSESGTVIFAAADFRPSPLHAVDSDRTVEALAEFLSLQPGDTDDEYFSKYTERQRFWIDGDGPGRLSEMISDLPGDTEYNGRIAAEADLAAEYSGEIRSWRVRPLERTDLPQVDMLADSPSNARVQYPAYVAAWIADTSRDPELGTDIFPALCVEPGGTSHIGPVVEPVRGQQTLDWAVGNVNHWGADAVIITGLIPSATTLYVPATGTATVAVTNATVIAHAGSHVEARRGSHITALSDSQVLVYPGAAVDRRQGASITLASEARIPHRGRVDRDSLGQQRSRGL